VLSAANQPPSHPAPSKQKSQVPQQSTAEDDLIHSNIHPHLIYLLPPLSILTPSSIKQTAAAVSRLDSCLKGGLKKIGECVVLHLVDCCGEDFMQSANNKWTYVIVKRRRKALFCAPI
jgi:hypothetical protein